MEFFGIDFRTIILGIMAVVNFIFATLIFLRSKLKSSIFFVLTTIGVAIWSVGINFYIQPGVTNLTFFWSDINYTVAAIFSVCFYFFGYYFATEDKKINQRKEVAIVASLVIILLLILSPGMQKSVITDIHEIAPYSKNQSFGWGFYLYSIFVFLYFAWGLTLLIKKYLDAKGVIKEQLKYIITGTGVTIVFGLLTNLILPALGVQGNDWMGPVGTVVFVSFVSYAIMRHHLWNFKIIALQGFIAFMILTLLLQIFIAENFIEISVKILIFIVVTTFSFFLIRELLREVDLREEMEHLARKLQTANERLEKIDIEKSDFVSITAHQVRTPLTVIKGYASMLLEGAFGDIPEKKQIKAIDQIFQASQRLVLIIQEFTNISRIERGEMKYTLKKIDLKDIISSSIEYFRRTLGEQRLKVIFNVPMGEPFIIEGDEERLQQVFSNIIDNAIKYTPHGGEISITIKNTNQNMAFQTFIADTGVGIQKDMMNRLFEKFSRTEKSFKLHTEGRGLGLYVAKQVIKAHGGKIWAKSNGNKSGVTFIVELPNPSYAQKRQEIKDFLEDI